ncbi:hypothetical protein B0F90DRAFT_1144982 [Multifurca ochricompacta]|uniref:Zn(2)-C6 fungal-type domain-containing protein n=1 Tax=Multifurca ochricompacta TaxID=376703 RepID=A0AAD4M0G9_9AGAM|nr:hypothetical protein B0F90DRAFT_1144982 [Multifurca ochricompacta]
MPIPCDKCKRAGALCSGMEGERCGRCRAIRKPCSHSTPLHPHQRQPPSSLSVAKSFQSRSRKKADTAAAPKLKPVVEKKVLVPPSSAQEETGGVANKRSSPESKGGGKLVFKSQVELTAGTPAKS